MQDHDTRELRLALVMTGGVSLAVWMGGVAGEIFRCIRKDGIYGDLCDLTATEVVVDVLSGASAGGMNGAFLGTAIAYDLTIDEFDELRDLWLSLGSFSKLLRDPMAKDPPSLLQGDEFFGPQVHDVLSSWVERKDRCVLSPPTNELTVILTASLLSAQLEPYTDDFDTAILEPRHRALFTFETEHFRDSATLPAKLALAARTTASFPGAFEASYIPIGEAGTPVADPNRPDMDGIASFDRSHWAVDGGVLANKPVGPALDAIMRRSSGREIRRVIAYVNPDPGSPRQSIDVRAAPPTIGDVVLKSIVTLPRAESIADHLDELRSINQRFSDTRELRDSLLRGVRVESQVSADGDQPTGRQPIPVLEIASGIYPYWIKQRSVRAVDDRLEAHFVRTRIDASATVAGALAADAVTFRELRLALQRERGRRAWLAPSLPSASADVDAEGDGVSIAGDDAQWRWGFQPLEYIADLALDLVRRTYTVLPIGDDGAVSELRRQLGERRQQAHDLRLQIQALRWIDDDFWADHLANVAADFPSLVDCAPDLATALYDRWPQPPASVVTLDAMAHARRLFGLAVADRDRVVGWRRFVAAVTRDDPTLLIAPAEALDGVSVQSATDMAGEIVDRLRRIELTIALHLAGAIWELRPLIADALVFAAAREQARVREVEPDACAVIGSDPAAVLREVAQGLGLLDVDRQAIHPDDEADAVRRILVALTALHVVQSTTDDPAETTYRLDLIQVSAFGANRVAPERRLPDQKVAGLQVGHFGAFLKRSWRANDWMWGAMDGADRMVSVLVEPARLRQRFVSADEALTELERIFTGQGRLGQQLALSERDFLGARWRAARPGIEAELGFLSQASGVVLPRRLPKLCALAAETAQLVIGRNLLPVVAQAVQGSVADGSGEQVEAVEFVEAVKDRLRPVAASATVAAGNAKRLTIEDVPGLLRKCRVGTETASHELSSDLGAATAAKAAAVAGSAASGSRSGLGALSVPVKSLRWGLMGVYFTSAAALRKTKIGIAVTFLLLAIAGGAIAARLLGADVPSPVMVVSVLLLAVWLLYTGASAKAWWPSIIGALALGVVALSFIEPEQACAVFADQGCPTPQPGWKGTAPWILTGVFAFVALACVVTAVRYRLDHSIEQAEAALGAEPVDAGVRPDGRSVTVMVVAAIVFAVLAALWVPVIHPFLFEGDGTSGLRSTVIGWVEALGNNRAIVTLVGIPAVFLGLEYLRLQLSALRSKLAHRRALRQLAAR